MPPSTITRRALVGGRMRGVTVAVLAVLALGISTADATPDGSPFARRRRHPRWNDLALDTVRFKTPPTPRRRASTPWWNVAMYDAVNGLSPVPVSRTRGLVEAGADVSGDPAAAAGAPTTCWRPYIPI